MRRASVVLPLVAAGCTGGSSSSQFASDAGASSTDVGAILATAASVPDYAPTLASLQQMTSDQWTSMMKSDLSNAPVMINGKTYISLKTLIEYTPDNIANIKAFDSQFKNVNAVRQLYNATTTSVSASDINDFLRISAAGLDYRKSGTYELGSSLDSPAYARALNVGLELSAATRGTPNAAFAAAAVHGLFYAVNAYMDLGSSSTSLGLLAGSGCACCKSEREPNTPAAKAGKPGSTPATPAPTTPTPAKSSKG